MYLSNNLLRISSTKKENRAPWEYEEIGKSLDGLSETYLKSSETSYCRVTRGPRSNRRTLSYTVFRQPLMRCTSRTGPCLIVFRDCVDFVWFPGLGERKEISKKKKENQRLETIQFSPHLQNFTIPTPNTPLGYLPIFFQYDWSSCCIF